MKKTLGQQAKIITDMKNGETEALLDLIFLCLFFYCFNSILCLLSDFDAQ